MTNLHNNKISYCEPSVRFLVIPDLLVQFLFVEYILFSKEKFACRLWKLLFWQMSFLVIRIFQIHVLRRAEQNNSLVFN